MDRTYRRIRWQNEPSTATPLDEDNLNRMDAALYEIDGRVVENRALIEGLQNYEVRAAEAAAESEASARESLASQQAAAISENNAKASEENSLQSEGNASRSEANALLSERAAAASEANAKTSEINAKASEDAAKESETHVVDMEENCGIYSRNAGQSAVNAARSATTSNNFALDSEAAARGTRNGENVPSTDEFYEDNSYYWSRQSKSHADDAENVLNMMEDAISENIPSMVVDFITGHLMWQGCRFDLAINNIGHLMWEVG